jgi:hypothetical protein
MKDNGRQMQIIKPGDTIVALADGVASSILDTGANIYIRLYTLEEGIKCSLAVSPLEAVAHTLVVGETFWICEKGFKVAVYGNTSDVELMY